MTTLRRPLLRYHGGKWRIAPWIISHFPPHRCYVEPFGGGGSVLLRKPAAYAEVYNDLDSEIVNLFMVARTDGQALRRLVELTPFSRDEFVISYTPSDDPIEQARRTMVRCGMGFGSSAMNTHHKTGFRGSAMRAGTHPGTDWKNQPDNLENVIQRLRGVIIENRDALEVIQYHDGPETLHYLDPPYPHQTRTWLKAKDAYRHEMSDDDHKALAVLCHSLQGKIIISGYPSDLYDKELYPGWRRVQKAALGDGAVKRTEVLWMNFKPQQRGLFNE